MEKIVICFAVFVLTGLFTASAQTHPKPNVAQSNNATTAAKHNSASTAMSDSDFARKAAEGGIAEVKLGQLAEEKGSSQEVKDFGKRMVNDHTKANEQLQSDAKKEKTSLPNTLNKKDQETYDRLSKLSGKAFDRAYARDMVRDHKADIVEFRNESNDGKQKWIRDFASQTLPTLEAHLRQAETMLRSVEPTSGTH